MNSTVKKSLNQLQVFYFRKSMNYFAARHALFLSFEESKLLWSPLQKKKSELQRWKSTYSNCTRCTAHGLVLNSLIIISELAIFYFSVMLFVLWATGYGSLKLPHKTLMLRLNFEKRHKKLVANRLFWTNSEIFWKVVCLLVLKLKHEFQPSFL